MLKICRTCFSTASGQFNSAPTRIHPTLAAKQFIPDQASRSKIRSLKRKENRLKRQIIRDVNNAKKQDLKSIKFKVDPVLGDTNSSFITRMNQELQEQSNLAKGYQRDEVEKLLYGASKASLDKHSGSTILRESVNAAEERKRRALLTILNIKNTSASDRKAIALRYAMSEFRRHEGDTASPEVQAAVLTVKIHMDINHVRQNPKDKAHIQYVRQLVQQRQRILKYLKRDDPEKYYYAIAKLGLSDDVIMTEFNMSKQYFQDYKVWGEKQLVKLSEKQKRKQGKVVELQKKIMNYNQLAKKNYEVIQNRVQENARV